MGREARGNKPKCVEYPKKPEDAIAFQPASGIAQVELRGTLFGQNVENILHFKFNTAITGTAIEDLANAMTEWVIEKYLGHMPAEYVYRETYVKDLTINFGAEYTSVGAAGLDGENGLALPGGSAWVVKFLTGSQGRSYRGRNYVLCNRDQTSGNFVSLAWATGVAANYAAILAALVEDAPEWTWVVLSRQTNGALRADGIGTPIVAVSYTDLAVDSQRRRLTGRGT